MTPEELAEAVIRVHKLQPGDRYLIVFDRASIDGATIQALAKYLWSQKIKGVFVRASGLPALEVVELTEEKHT